MPCLIYFATYALILAGIIISIAVLMANLRRKKLLAKRLEMFGRVAQPLFILAEEHEGIEADLTLIGKALSGGFYPISAVLSNSEVMGVLQSGDHGSTFGGNPLAWAIVRTALKVLVEENMIENAAEIGTYFLNALRQINNPMIKEVRGIGLMIGLEFAEYMSKESLAQQGGFGLALKGPQHVEAWLIMLDMVHDLMSTFEQKAEALFWFPMFRTWFGLCGLCKLPWNDIVPEDNIKTKEPAKVQKHVDWYAEYYKSVTGEAVHPDDLIQMSETVYNFQRIFNLRMGFGKSEHDNIPYRAMGPVTIEEYLSRQDRYDKELEEKYHVKLEDLATEKRISILRKKREEQYEKLKRVVYQRRGWNADGIPTMKTVKRLKIDFPEVLNVLKTHGV